MDGRMRGTEGKREGETPEAARRLTGQLRAVAESCSMSLFGAACFVDCENLAPPSLPFRLGELPHAVSIGYRLSDPVMESLVDRPTRTYQYHYRQVNSLIDHTLLKLLGKLHECGYQGFPVPSSQVVDWQAYTGHLSHKVVASVAGLGWIGRNNLLISPMYGARVRYGTIFTDAPLEIPADAGAAGLRGEATDCGDCYACLHVCPARAIGRTREEFQLEKCRATLKQFEKSENIGSMICGLCIKACSGRST